MSRHFTDWINAYVQLFDPITESPTKLHWWTAISVIGGALTRRVCIDEVTFQYYPNFCIIFVAPPGIVSKSTTINHGMGLLRELPHIRFADDATTYPEFVRALAAADNTFVFDDPSADPTKMDWLRQCAMTAAVSELGTFLKVEDEDALNCFTDLLDCRSSYVKSTKHNGRDEIECPFVNILGATTPSWIQDKLKAQIGGWGLSSRIIFVYADRKKQYIWSPSAQLANKTHFDHIHSQLVDDLAQIASLHGTMKATKDADKLCKKWYEDTQARSEAYQESPEYDNWTGYFLARKPVHMRKLAMILSISRSDDLLIEKRDVEGAISVLEGVERDIVTVFKPKAVTTALALNEQAVLERIVAEVTAAGRMTKKAALLRAVRFVDSDTAVRIVDNAIGRGVFSIEQSGATLWLQPPSTPTNSDC